MQLDSNHMTFTALESKHPHTRQPDGNVTLWDLEKMQTAYAE
jgi:hypothetical protein